MDDDGEEMSLLQAARFGRVDTVRSLLARKTADVRQVDGDGRSPLHWAARYGHDDVMQLLLPVKGADVRQQDADGRTPLHWATRYGHKKVVEALVSGSDADLTLTDHDGRTPLHWACDGGHGDVVALLLRKELLATKMKDRFGRSALHWAAEGGYLDVVDQLLAKLDAEINLKDTDGRTPLHLAAGEGHSKIVRKILDKKGLTATVEDKEEKTALHVAAERGHADSVDLLLDYCDVKQMDAQGRTALYLAVGGGHVAVVKALLMRSETDMNQADRRGRTPLYLAIRYGFTDIVQLLRTSGRMKIDADGTSMLQFAARHGHAAIVELLQDTKSDAASKLSLHVAARYGHTDVVKVLLKMLTKQELNTRDNDERTPLHWAAEEGRVEVTRLLLDSGSDVMQKDRFGRTPLHLASNNGHLDVVELVLIEGADFNALDRDGRTPIHWAAERGRDKVVKRLLQLEDVAVQVKDLDGRTPLHLAARYGRNEVVKILLNRGTGAEDMKSTDAFGRTPLHLAADGGHVEAVSIFLQNPKSNVTLKDRFGRTPLHWASLYKRADVVQCLLDHDVMAVNVKDRNDKTPVQLAIESHDEATVTVFVEAMNKADSAAKQRAFVASFLGEFVDEKGQRVSLIEKLISIKMEEVALALLNKCVSRAPDLDNDLILDYRLFMTSTNTGTTSTRPHRLLNRTLDRLIESNCIKTLTHPVVLAIVISKWRLVRLLMLIYCLLVTALSSLLTAHLFLAWSPITVCNDLEGRVGFVYEACEQIWYNSTCSDACAAMVAGGAVPLSTEASSALRGTRFAIIVLSVLLLLVDFCQLCIQLALSTRKERSKLSGEQRSSRLTCGNCMHAFMWTLWHYIYDTENLLQLFSFSSAIVVVWEWTACSEDVGLKCSYQWQLGAFSVLVLWLNLLFQLRKLLAGGTFVLMFLLVLKSFARYGLFLFLFILSFAVPLSMLLARKDAYKKFQDSLLKTSAMLAGALDYDIMFDANTRLMTAVYVIFILFVFVIVLIIQNLITGVALSDVNKIHGQASLKRLQNIIETCIEVEGGLTEPLVKLGACCCGDTRGVVAPKDEGSAPDDIEQPGSKPTTSCSAGNLILSYVAPAGARIPISRIGDSKDTFLDHPFPRAGISWTDILPGFPIVREAKELATSSEIDLLRDALSADLGVSVDQVTEENKKVEFETNLEQGLNHLELKMVTLERSMYELKMSSLESRRPKSVKN